MEFAVLNLVVLENPFQEFRKDQAGPVVNKRPFDAAGITTM